MTATSTAIRTRLMTNRDIPSVMVIEHTCFGRQWHEIDFVNFLLDPNMVGLVAESNNRIVGYCVYRVAAKSIDVLTIAVFPVYRRIGVGSALVANMKAHTSETDRSIDVIVWDRDAAGLKFCWGHGFRHVRTLDNPFCESDETGILMRFDGVE